MQTNLLTDCVLVIKNTGLMKKGEKDSDFAKRFNALVASMGWVSINNKKLTKKELGDKLGVSAACAFYYGTGERLPSIDQARDLCAILGGACVEWLLTGRGPKYPYSDNPDDFICISGLTDDQKDFYRKSIAMLIEANKAR